MCNGTLMDKLIVFAVPLMISGVLQLMFNAVDIIVVGQYSGSQSLAGGGLHDSPDQYLYESVYRYFYGRQCTGGRFYAAARISRCLSTVIRQFWCADQRRDHDLCGSGDGPVGAGSDGDA